MTAVVVAAVAMSRRLTLFSIVRKHVDRSSAYAAEATSSPSHGPLEPGELDRVPSRERT
jgi:hypothetical protein